ncbi:SDR family NAD(P)-dependent oxidoreductase [Spongiactinospora sp. TRM90649]|uniref:SDR family NAD(P)-dependent oxidoreductase n=1 Tax=Spongiactinospora sp. TRM90649 TaxID=3031114 RepID=UPI0023FA1471|nr:SDR family NAD(P)-dependent oxidoreductase [Spongiactinospora sp. TRM90649]MDF5753197.1 SDR family NAD(P)-dependent oxidoreductase [Spongiactinospora sp. TRM90649]
MPDWNSDTWHDNGWNDTGWHDTGGDTRPEQPFARSPERRDALVGKVVVVTGADGAVGRAVGGRLGQEGAHVGLIAGESAGLATAAVEVGAAGGSGMVYEADPSDLAQVRTAAERIEADLGPIDVWINVTFPTEAARFADMDPREFERVTDEAYLGCAWGTRVALDLMRPRGHGVIVQAGSTLSYRGVPLRSAYCGAEHAISGMTESIRTELLEEGSALKITTVRFPAPAPTDDQDGSAVHRPDAVAEAMVFAALHPERKEHRVGASTAATLIAQRVAPAVVDRYLARGGAARDRGKARYRSIPVWVSAAAGAAAGAAAVVGSALIRRRRRQVSARRVG